MAITGTVKFIDLKGPAHPHWLVMLGIMKTKQESEGVYKGTGVPNNINDASIPFTQVFL